MNHNLQCFREEVMVNMATNSAKPMPMKTKRQNTFIMEEASQWVDKKRRVDDPVASIVYTKQIQGIKRANALERKKDNRERSSTIDPELHVVASHGTNNQTMIPLYPQNKSFCRAILPIPGNGIQNVPGRIMSTLPKASSIRSTQVVHSSPNRSNLSVLHQLKLGIQSTNNVPNYYAFPQNMHIMQREIPVIPNSPCLVPRVAAPNNVNLTSAYTYSIQQPYIHTQSLFGTYSFSTMGIPRYMRVLGKTNIIIERDTSGYKCPGCPIRIKYRWELKHHFSVNPSHISNLPKECLCFEFQNHIYALYDIDE